MTDRSSYPLFERNASSFLEEQRVVLVDLNQIPMTPEHRTFRAVCPIEATHSGGLWFYALERFFVLFDFLAAHPLEHIIHLESDTMLYCALDELIPLFQKSGMKLAAPFQSLVGCIPVFSSSPIEKR